jgi:cyclic-di-GMP-binding protein
MELGIGIQAAHHFIPKVGSEFKNFMTPNSAIKPSRWQILNAGAGGYALRKFNSSLTEMHVGDIAAIKNSKSLNWELGVLRWANINDLNQLDAGIELISPSASAIKIESDNLMSEGLLLPEITALKQPASIIAPRSKYTLGQSLQIVLNDKFTKVQISKLIERTPTFERFQFDLI